MLVKRRLNQYEIAPFGILEFGIACKKFGIQFQLRIVNGFMILCLNKLQLSLFQEEGGLSIECNFILYVKN